MYTEPQRVQQVDFQGIQVAAPLAIAALGALYAIAFSRRWTITQNQSFSRPAGVRLPRGEILTRIEEMANYQPRTQAPGRTKTGGTSPFIAWDQQECVSAKADREASWRGSVPGNFSAIVNRKRDA